MAAERQPNRATTSRETGRLPSRVQSAFALLSVMLAALLVVCTSDSSRPNVVVRGEETATQLTDSQARDRFLELHRNFRQASRERNLSGLSHLVTNDSPLVEVAEQDVKQLIADGVIDRSVFRNVQIDVMSASPSEVRIKQVVVIHPRFIHDKSGRKLDASAPIRQTVEWTLQYESSGWKVHDAVVVASEKLGR